MMLERAMIQQRVMMIEKVMIKLGVHFCKPPGRLFLLQSIKGSAGIGSSAWSTCEVHISCTPPWHFVPTAKMYGVEHLIALSHLALLGACSRPHLLLLEDREAHELP